jgi:transcription-repair coupling factor (superfamily II helicase)
MMAGAGMATTALERLRELAERLESHEGFAEVVASLLSGHAATLDGVWGSSCALAAAALLRHVPATLVVIRAREELADSLLEDLALFTPAVAARFPAAEPGAAQRAACDVSHGERLRVLKRLQSPQPPPLVVTSIQALLQPVPPPTLLASRTRRLRVGETLSPAEISRWLVEQGYHGATGVELPGEYAVRGGIIDVFAPDWESPVRIELFGEEIESIRRFAVETQRSLETLQEVELTGVVAAWSGRGHLADYLPSQSWLMLVEPAELEQEGQHYLRRVADAGQQHDFSELMRRVLCFPTIATWGLAPSSLEATCRLRIESVERFSGDLNRVREELDAAAAGQQVYVVCQTEAEMRRLSELFATTGAAREDRLHFPLGTLHEGFRLVRERVVLLGSGELFRRQELQRPAHRRLGRAIDSFLELRPGDLVVHVAHGIARYRGLELLDRNGQLEEHLMLEFAGQTKLYVPSSKIGLVQKYLGGAKSRPTLARLGGRHWDYQKRRVAQAVTDFAAEMLELQAVRASQPGIAFPPDTEWQQEFDASFPFHETPDQLAAIEAIKADMCQPRPMDRLLCGDVGYGKTELAMRAAFKAVDAGYQVAVLVPTTVLAEQHYRTFSARMAEFPFEIAALSRFATRKQQERIIERLAAGKIDIVIGTHRLVQPDVRFHNLGLAIIDEEQRFGVEVKERLKAYRRMVDVLTMTATPIPRTLHLSLLGVRDISNLETPPEDRLAVETHVTRFEPELIRHAVLRELSRGGQIFFVHNRVEDICKVAWQLQQIVPEARLAIAHGQMPEHELEQVMLDFVAHRSDLLLATTIVENGLDIPNANTIFIDEADRYGLADLHQLRGRVGRYKHRAYCYLLVDPNKYLSPNAARRLRAIEEFSDMGAGFAIAMRDLEIRGAGNILGAEQSGHIAAVGYELYCTLLEDAIRRLKQMPPRESIDVDIDLPLAAFLPRSYVPDIRMKIDLYRRLARVTNLAELEDFQAELLDRFGPPPETARNLLVLAELRIAAHRWRIGSIRLENGYVVLGYSSAARIEQLRAKSRGALRIVDQRSAYLPIGAEQPAAEIVFQQLKSLLQSD